MRKTLTILLGSMLLLSCAKREKNLFGFKIEPVKIDCAVMHQLNENGDVIEVLDNAVNGYIINYELRGDTLLGHFNKGSDKFEWYGLYDFKLRSKYCDICNSYMFTAKNNSNIIFHTKENRVIAVEMRNNYDKVVFKSK